MDKKNWDTSTSSQVWKYDSYELYFSSYATKADLKNRAGVDTLDFA